MGSSRGKNIPTSEKAGREKRRFPFPHRSMAYHASHGSGRPARGASMAFSDPINVNGLTYNILEGL